MTSSEPWPRMLAQGDVTARLVPASEKALARMVIREPAVLSGMAWFEECFHQKENHIASAGGIGPALEQARKLAPDVPVEIEVETIAQLQEAIAAGAKLILLDNFDLAGLREAVRVAAGRAALEASGGINLETVGAIAQTGVERISIGSLTKDIRAVDLSMRFVAA